MEHRSPPSIENDTPNMDEVLQAISDIQTIDIDKLRAFLLENLNQVGGNVMQKRKHSLEPQKRETDIVSECLQEEQEFRKEYVKAFGEMKINDLHKTMEDLKKKIDTFQKRINELRARNKDLEENKWAALEENAKLCLRLKTHKEDRMCYGNANITDLSDQNRHNELSERYTELFSNQWRYAFTVLTETHEQSEENAAEILLKLLIECHTFSEMRARQQMSDLVRSIYGETTVKVGDGIERHLKEARKLFDVRYADILFQECVRHVGDNVRVSIRYLHEKELKSYLIECFQLCWLMAIQDPPLVLGKEAKYGDAFNLEFYDPYTRNGNLIQFVVWPPLLLYKGGPVLSKGVARPIQVQNYSKRKYAWGSRNMTGQREQPRGRTTEQDLMLGSIRDTEDPRLLMHTQYPPTPKSTSAQHIQPTGKQERAIISTHVGYDMDPTETSYSGTNVDMNGHERFTSTLGCGTKSTKSRVTTEDVLTSSKRTESRHGIDIRGQNNVDSTAMKSSLHTRCTSPAYAPLQRHEKPQFHCFQIKLALHGVDQTKAMYGGKFDRFYTLLRRGTAG
ncbi:hypothetical protein ACJMK2_030583 [Sinanodonta woodiana]|uniref:Mitochondria-eating protein n=1 Tax=Sinanodonta woodiana TaxID=1069815 RepID=A0ABD3X052_SINWO